MILSRVPFSLVGAGGLEPQNVGIKIHYYLTVRLWRNEPAERPRHRGA